MIGNDVVDLALTEQESNWQRKGFLEKIFTVDEQLRIENAADKSVLIWTMWSQKEAVYKILRQKGASRGFYPLKITCLNAENVRYQNEDFYTKTSKVETSLQTLAVTKKTDFDKCRCLSLAAPLVYEKEIPFYLKNGIQLYATKSHHGRFESIYFLEK
jgi:phosphopantetheinyl transferase (holo-ACP synthase)